MCGVAGIIRLDGSGLVDPEDLDALEAMSAAIANRGHDDATRQLWGQAALALRRLSIIDPSGGRQPLFNNDGSIVVVCNGEIFNHRELRAARLPGVSFRTGSDCEVIAHLYETEGIAALCRLNGMFAGAIL